MDRIVWNEANSVGIAEMDAQLRKIAGLINMLGEHRSAAAPNRRIEPIVDALGAEVARHFRRKEKLLAKRDCDGLWPEGASRHNFAEALQRYRARVSEGVVSLQALHDFLVRWWHEHVQETQAEFAAAANGRSRRRRPSFGPLGPLVACLWQAAFPDRGATVRRR